MSADDPSTAHTDTPVHADFAIRLRSRLAIHTGRPGATVDDTVPRDARRSGRAVPVIPATVVKGAARAALVRYDHPFSDGARREAFGGAHTLPGMLRFSTARPPDDHQLTIGEITNVALTAERTAQPGRLRTVEVVEELAHCGDEQTATIFHGTLAADPTVTADPDEPAPQQRRRAERSLAVGLCGLAAVTALGSRTNRGLGAVAVIIDPDAPVAPGAGTVGQLLHRHVDGLAEAHRDHTEGVGQ